MSDLFIGSDPVEKEAVAERFAWTGHSGVSRFSLPDPQQVGSHLSADWVASRRPALCTDQIEGLVLLGMARSALDDSPTWGAYTAPIWMALVAPSTASAGIMHVRGAASLSSLRELAMGVAEYLRRPSLEAESSELPPVEQLTAGDRALLARTSRRKSPINEYVPVADDDEA
jgi:hypothetical protein